MNGYQFQDFYFEKQDEYHEILGVKHSALYHYMTHLANKLHWPKSFGLPSDITMMKTRISSYRTYSNALHDLQECGLIKIVSTSKNQYSATTISLVIPDVLDDKKAGASVSALDDASVSAYDSASVSASVKNAEAQPSQRQSHSSHNKTYKTLNVINIKPINVGKGEKSDEIDFQIFVDHWNQTYKTNARLTDSKRKQIRARLRTFNQQEILQAMSKRSHDHWLNNVEPKFLTDWNAFWRSDEKIEKYLTTPTEHLEKNTDGKTSNNYFNGSRPQTNGQRLEAHILNPNEV